MKTISTSHLRPLGQTGLNISPIGFGAFKIGRNQKTKYPQAYDLPDDVTVNQLLNEVLDTGINHIDTAPAYGLSEERIGHSIAHRRDEFILSTKVGETFEANKSVYDFSATATKASVLRSLKRLKTDFLDIVFIHSDGNDFHVLRETDVVPTLLRLKEKGVIRNIGFSGKQPQAVKETFIWADVAMIEYHLDDQSHADVITEAAKQGVGLFIKKGLAAGHLPPEKAITFLLNQTSIHSIVIGGLNIKHIQNNLKTALECTS